MLKKNIEILYKQEKDRWIKGDRFIRPFIRNILRKKERFSGMETVVLNFKKGLIQQSVDFSYNKYSIYLNKKNLVISFGLGRKSLAGLNKKKPIIAAIGFPIPSEDPELCNHYNIKKYLQHSNWILDIAKSCNEYPVEIFDLWPAGIDTDLWCDTSNHTKDIDVLIYNKLYWNDLNYVNELLNPITNYCLQQNLIIKIINYGSYLPNQYKELLQRSKCMIFLSAHETQGFACLEALSSNVPVLAWDPGIWLDPVRFKYNLSIVQATSIPFFDESCGLSFTNLPSFFEKFETFFNQVTLNKFSPRVYVLNNLSIKESTMRMLQIIHSI